MCLFINDHFQTYLASCEHLSQSLFLSFFLLLSISLSLSLSHYLSLSMCVSLSFSPPLALLYSRSHSLSLTIFLLCQLLWYSNVLFLYASICLLSLVSSDCIFLYLQIDEVFFHFHFTYIYLNFWFGPNKQEVTCLDCFPASSIPMLIYICHETWDTTVTLRYLQFHYYIWSYSMKSL